jgi:hypothetical protein
VNINARLIAGWLLVAAPLAVGADIEVASGEDSELRLGGLAQVLGVGQEVYDPSRADERLYLFLKTARLRTSGRYQDYSFNVELAFGGEEVAAAPTPGVSAGLLDFSFRIPFGASSYVQVGQFKVPYGRERLTYSGFTQFADRSIQDLGFRVGRDVGVAVTTRPGPATVVVGLFTGGGRDLPQRYIPERLGVPLLVMRAGIGNVDDDVYVLRQSEPNIEGMKYGFFVNGIYTRDTVVGHSSALNVKLADKSLLLNANWNPYIARAPHSQGDYWQAGADAALRLPLGSWSATAEAEGNWGAYRNRYGVLHLAGARVQAGLLRGPLELAARYAVLFPDKKFRSGNVGITGEKPIHEVTPAISYAFHGNMMKLTADLPVIWKAPVVIEPWVGSYVTTDHPDQVSQLAKASRVERHVVIAGRLMFQAGF